MQSKRELRQETEAKKMINKPTGMYPNVTRTSRYAAVRVGES